MDTFTQMLEDDLYGPDGVTPYLSAFTYETHVIYFDQNSDGYLNIGTDAGFTYQYSLSADDLYVAGYQVSYISGNAIYGIDEDGFVDKGESSSRMINAEYAFDMNEIPDGENAYLDLLKKMSDIYGNSVDTYTSDFSEDTFWFGGNQTYVKLSRTIGGDLDGAIYIEYGIILF